MVFRCIVGIGDDSPEAKLLVLVLGRRVIAGGGLLVVRYRVGLGPAGHDEGLSSLVDGHVLVRAALGVSVATDPDGISVLVCGEQANALTEAGQRSHGPAVPPVLQAAVFQQIQIGRRLSAFQLEVVHVDISANAVGIDADGVGFLLRRGKGQTEPYPPAVNCAVRGVVQALAGGDHRVSVHDLEVDAPAQEGGAF